MSLTLVHSETIAVRGRGDSWWRTTAAVLADVFHCMRECPSGQAPIYPEVS